MTSDDQLRHWIIRKYEAGTRPAELRRELEADGEDPAAVDRVLDDYRDTPSPGDRPDLAGYKSVVSDTIGIKAGFLANIDAYPLPHLLLYAAFNSVLGMTYLFLLVLLDGPASLAASLLVLAALGALAAAWVAVPVHAVARLLGGTGALSATVKLYLAGTAVYLIGLVPLLNLFAPFYVPLYGAVIAIRGVETVHDITFYRAVAAVAAGSLLAAALGLGLLVAAPY